MRSANTTTKRELIERIADQTGQSQNAVKQTLQCFLENVIAEMRAGRRLELREFGVFEIYERAGRLAQNPKTLEPVAIPPRKTVRFKTGRLLKEALDHNGDGAFLMIDEDE